MQRWIKRLAILLGVVLVVVLLRATVFKPDPLPVTVYEVDRGQVDETAVNSRAGSVCSRREAELSPSLSGLVAEVVFEKGQRVEKGEVLLRIDDAEYSAQLLLAKRAYAAAKGAEKEACLRAEQAERSYQRNLLLAGDALISEELFEEIENVRDITATECAVSAERTKQAAASFASAKAVFDKTSLLAPFTGTLADVNVEAGEWVGPSAGLGGWGGASPVMKLVDLENVYVSAPIDEVDAVRIELGQLVRITLDALPEQSFDGTLTWISPVVDATESQNRTVEVEASFAGGAELANIVPGLSADIEVILDSRADVVRIPTYAVLEGNTVLVVRDGQLEETEVEVGLRNWQFAEITSGLSPGELVVVSLDREEIQDGAKVEVRADE